MFKITRHPLGKAAAGGLLALSALSLSACGDTTGPEAGADVESIQEEADDDLGYDGPYDTGFYEDVNTYVGKKVTVSADVNRVLSPTSFVIAGTDDTTVDPLLVVSAEKANQIAPDLAVKVTGTVKQDFDIPTVEREMGVDLDDELFDDFDGEPYIEATKIDTSVPADQ